jgi:hypothetical protein
MTRAEPGAPQSRNISGIFDTHGHPAILEVRLDRQPGPPDVKRMS